MFFIFKPLGKIPEKKHTRVCLKLFWNVCMVSCFLSLHYSPLPPIYFAHPCFTNLPKTQVLMMSLPCGKSEQKAVWEKTLLGSIGSYSLLRKTRILKFCHCCLGISLIINYYCPIKTKEPHWCPNRDSKEIYFAWLCCKVGKGLLEIKFCDIILCHQIWLLGLATAKKLGDPLTLVNLS